MSEKEAKELINKMLFYQKLYTGKTDVTVFQEDFAATTRAGGIAWGATTEGFHWWNGKVRTKHGNVRKILLKLMAICPLMDLTSPQRLKKLLLINKFILFNHESKGTKRTGKPNAYQARRAIGEKRHKSVQKIPNHICL